MNPIKKALHKEIGKNKDVKVSSKERFQNKLRKGSSITKSYLSEERRHQGY